MASKKYYAVKAGKTTGVFQTWSECELAIKGYPSAEYKKFSSQEEAEAYVAGIDIYLAQVKNDISQGYIVAYTDGSYNEETGDFSYGVCIIDENEREINLCSKIHYEPFSSSRNVAGEVYAVLTALDWAVSNGYDRIKIYHDLESLAQWADGTYKATSEISKYYVSRLREQFSGIINFEFVKVKGHSGNPYNNKADLLAENAFKGETKLIQGANSFTVNNINDRDFNTIINLIEEDNDGIEKNRKSIAGGIQIKLSISSKIYTTIKYYDNQKVLVQGKANVLYQMVLTYMSELIGKENITTFVKRAYRIKIDDEAINSNYAALCPRIPEEYNVNIIKLIKQAIINLNNYVQSEDYGQYAFPALRALEGHIKVLFLSQQIHVADRFEQFTGDTINGYRLKTSYSIDAAVKEKIESCYNYYHMIRHKLFHFGDVIGSTDNTYMISDKNEVDQIIRDTISLINRTI